MYQSKKSIALLPTQILKKTFLEYIEKNPKIRCHILKRSIFFDEASDSMLKRKDVKTRLECFSVGIDIIRKSSVFEKKIIKGSVCYEITGLAKGLEQVKVHLKEITKKNDKKLFFISSFYKK